MALDELHARRLATVVTVAEDALARIELTLERQGRGGRRAPARNHALRQKIASMRRVLERAVERFGLRPVRPEPRQLLAAELSSLWVVLENALPKRLKGYGREWEPADKADWEKSIQSLLHTVTELRSLILDKDENPE
jgi:hypothetical protein